MIQLMVRKHLTKDRELEKVQKAEVDPPTIQDGTGMIFKLLMFIWVIYQWVKYGLKRKMS